MLHPITIGNRRNGDTGAYVGRPSPLGNPFVIGRDGDRAAVIARYRTWLDERLRTHPKALAALDRLVERARAEPLTLVCWCAPEPCHAEAIAEAMRRRDAELEAGGA